MATLLYRRVGRIDYPAALDLQHTLLDRKQRAPLPDVLLFVEHPHVYTIGRAGKLSNVLGAGEVPVYRTGRGGDVTYHGPGQVVVYPLIDLRSKLRRDVHRYLANLEQTALRTVEAFGLRAERRPPYTGIWIGDRKIAAIGVAVRRSVTFHGLALNVNTDLSYFERIVPCGLAWAGVTSLARELGAEQNCEQVEAAFLDSFAAIFGYSDVCKAEDRQWTAECFGFRSGSGFELETRNSELETAKP